MKDKQSILILFVGVAYLFLWFDMGIGHFAAKMNHVGMWIPAVFLPFAFLISVIFAWRISRLYQNLFFIVSLAAIFVGLIGFTFHFLKFVQVFNSQVEWAILASTGLQTPYQKRPFSAR